MEYLRENTAVKTNVLEFRGTEHSDEWRNDAIARSFIDGLTGKQRIIAKRLASKLELDANDISWSLYDCALGELSRCGAERLISYLEEMVYRPAAVSLRRAG